MAATSARAEQCAGASARALHAGRIVGYGDYTSESLRARLAEQGWLLVAGVPCWIGNTALLDLAATIGPIKSHGPYRGDLAREGESVNIIRALPEPIPDVSGKIMLSTMAVDHHMHTDESFFATPSRYVLLHCWRPDPAGGGLNTVADLADVLARLTDAERADCVRLRYSWRGVESPIVGAPPDGGPLRVRFNVREAQCLERDTAAGDALAQRFAHAAEEAAVGLALGPGDCLVLDNWRVLHGRTAFAPDSPRLLKRVGVGEPA
ncbi:MAG: TauD/TfdA family dioxygenase [Candidatus Odyssella sp.]|nr:TauD/TfdA family dioxygenase [Candidatus Odyssella sp.]